MTWTWSSAQLPWKIIKIWHQHYQNIESDTKLEAFVIHGSQTGTCIEEVIDVFIY